MKVPLEYFIKKNETVEHNVHTICFHAFKIEFYVLRFYLGSKFLCISCCQLNKHSSILYFKFLFAFIIATY